MTPRAKAKAVDLWALLKRAREMLEVADPESLRWRERQDALLLEVDAALRSAPSGSGDAFDDARRFDAWCEGWETAVDWLTHEARRGPFGTTLPADAIAGFRGMARAAGRALRRQPADGLALHDWYRAPSGADRCALCGGSKDDVEDAPCERKAAPKRKRWKR